MAPRRSGAAGLRAEWERVLAGRSKTDRKLLLVGLLNKALGPARRAVLVGGAAVEFYTSGAYLTGDVDLVCTREDVRRVLLSAGFQEEGRYFLRAEFGLLVEVPSRDLRPTETPVLVEFEGLTVPMVAVEDAIVDRLLAAKFWRSPTDWEQAILLYAAHRGSLDSRALRDKAERNEVSDSLDQLARAVEADSAA